MEITIRKRTEADLPQIYGLIQELALFEKVADRMTNTLPLMIVEQDHMHAFVAVTADARIMGYATYNHVYYTWAGKSIYMDDLYVQQAYRGLGVGSKLIQAVIEYAKASGCHKIRWQVSEWNAPAILFYKKLGAKINAIEQNCDLIL